MNMPKTNETSPSSEHREEDRHEAQPLQARLVAAAIRRGSGTVVCRGGPSALIGDSGRGPGSREAGGGRRPSRDLTRR